jgi:hypothetical protein
MQGAPILLHRLEYALIRSEIVATAQMELPREPGTVFVSMGGSDPRELTLPIVQGLAESGVRAAVTRRPAHLSRTEASGRLASLDGVCSTFSTATTAEALRHSVLISALHCNVEGSTFARSHSLEVWAGRFTTSRRWDWSGEYPWRGCAD